MLSEITKKQEERKGNRLVLGYGVVASEELYFQNQKQDILHSNINRKSFGFYHLDEQNSTAFITGRNQEIQNFYQYDAFGNVRNQKEILHNRILYTGQQYDNESNQYYLRARYYNPTLGRFTQEDVYRGDGLNLYDYCKGNPVIWYDPSGLKSKRTKYLGKTLSMNSPGGRKVIEEAFKAGDLDISEVTDKKVIQAFNDLESGKGGLVASKVKITSELKSQIKFKSKADEKFYYLNQANMSHKNTKGHKDAVTMWNEELYKYGAKSKAARAYMLNPNNYYLELGSYNKSDGAKLKDPITGKSVTYRDPAEKAEQVTKDVLKKYEYDQEDISQYKKEKCS